MHNWINARITDILWVNFSSNIHSFYFMNLNFRISIYGFQIYLENNLIFSFKTLFFSRKLYFSKKKLYKCRIIGETCTSRYHDIVSFLPDSIIILVKMHVNYNNLLRSQWLVWMSWYHNTVSSTNDNIIILVKILVYMSM